MSDGFCQVCCAIIFVYHEVFIFKYVTCRVVKKAIMFKINCDLIACFGIVAVYRISNAHSQACNVKWIIIYYSHCAGYTCARVSCCIIICSVCISDSRSYIASIKVTSFTHTVIRGRISWTAIRCNDAWIIVISIHKYHIICISDQLYCRRYCIDKHVLVS